MNFLFDNWGVVVSIISAISVIAINEYKTKKNITDTKKNSEDIEKLKEDHSSFITLEKARETFVSKELHDNQMKHIDITLGEIKQQNQQSFRDGRKFWDCRINGNILVIYMN